MKYQMSQRPGSGAQRAYILGARLNSGNIGEAIVNRLYSEGWHVLGDDCLNPSLGLYVSPTVEQFEEADADALVITLGRTYNESFDSLDPNTITHALDANLTLPLEAARRYVEANKIRAKRWHVGAEKSAGSSSSVRTGMSTRSRTGRCTAQLRLGSTPPPARSAGS
jgi:hypothetical protein